MCAFIKELWPLTTVRITYQLNILRLNEVNLRLNEVNFMILHIYMYLSNFTCILGSIRLSLANEIDAIH